MMLLNFLIGVATGIVSGFGVGGGSLLVLYLTAVIGMEQQIAGGINLLYFIGCAPAALVGHIRHKQVEWRAVWWCTAAAVAAAIPTALVFRNADASLIRRLFGLMLLYVGIRELRAGRKQNNK